MVEKISLRWDSVECHRARLLAAWLMLGPLCQSLDYLGQYFKALRCPTTPLDEGAKQVRVPRRLAVEEADSARRYDAIMRPITDNVSLLCATAYSNAHRYADLSRQLNCDGDIAEDDLADLEASLRKYAADFFQVSRSLLDLDDAALDALGIFPNNPARVSYDEATGQLVMIVTQASLEQVKEMWTQVEMYQATLRALGLSHGRGRGAPHGPQGPRDPKIKEWVARAGDVGEVQAKQEYLRSVVNTDDRTTETAWWNKNVRPHVKRLNLPRPNLPQS